MPKDTIGLADAAAAYPSDQAEVIAQPTTVGRAVVEDVELRQFQVGGLGDVVDSRFASGSEQTGGWDAERIECRR